MYRVGIAYLLWLISGCGWFGLHRFYLGKIPTGLLWMFTGGLCGIGSIYDFFTLPSQVRRANMERAILSAYGFGNRHDSRQADAAREAETVEHAILKLAKANSGIITASDVAIAANIPLEKAKNDLDALVARNFAEMRVRRTGSIVYTFPEMMDRNEPLEDF